VGEELEVEVKKKRKRKKIGKKEVDQLRRC
jgi:hypothetical protein